MDTVEYRHGRTWTQWNIDTVEHGHSGIKTRVHTDPFT